LPAFTGSSLKRYVRQVLAVAGFLPSASGAKLDRRIALIAGFSKIL
jgi:hypothetical protein